MAKCQKLLSLILCFMLIFINCLVYKFPAKTEAMATMVTKVYPNEQKATYENTLTPALLIEGNTFLAQSLDNTSNISAEPTVQGYEPTIENILQLEEISSTNALNSTLGEGVSCDLAEDLLLTEPLTSTPAPDLGDLSESTENPESRVMPVLTEILDNTLQEEGSAPPITLESNLVEGDNADLAKVIAGPVQEEIPISLQLLDSAPALTTELTAKVLNQEDSLDAVVENTIIPLRAPINITSLVNQLSTTITHNGAVITGQETIPPSIVIGDVVRFDIRWELLNILENQLIAGDYFEFDLPSQYFTFSASNEVNLMSSDNELIGSFKVYTATDSEPAKIRITLNQTAVEKQYIINGYVQGSGVASLAKTEDESTNVGSEILPPFVIVPDDPNMEYPGTTTVEKSGWQLSNQDKVAYQLYVNFDEAKKVYANPGYVPAVKNNLVLTDELPAGMVFDEDSVINMYAPIYPATNTGAMSAINLGGWADIAPIFTKHTGTGANWAGFKSMVAGGAAPAYGVYQDTGDGRYKIVMNFGNFPGTIQNPYSLNDIKAIIQASSLSDTSKAQSIAVYERIFSQAVTGGSGLLSLVIRIDYLPIVSGSGPYINNAVLTWGGSNNASSQVTINFQELSGGATTGEPQSVTIKKYEENTTVLLANALFKLQKMNAGGVYEDYIPLDGQGAQRLTDETGEIVFKQLSNGEYKVVEVTPPSGYSSQIRFKDNVDTFTINGSETGTIFITAYNTSEITSLAVSKVWSDGNNQDGLRPTAITVQLQADGSNYGSAVTLNQANNWAHTWANLPQKANGTDIVYTVTEPAPPTGYTVAVDGSNPNNVIITNSHAPGVTSLAVSKVWNDGNNQDGLRPAAITVQLQADGSNYGSTVTLNQANNWAHTWANLPQKANGTDIVYTVTEPAPPTGYTVAVDGSNPNNVIITNSHTPNITVNKIPERTTLSVSKTWEDSNDQAKLRPQNIQVQLYANGEAYEMPVTLSQANNWYHSWVALPTYENDMQVVYTVREINIPDGYVASQQRAGLSEIRLINTITSMPKTGDEGRGDLYFILIILSAAAAIVLMNRHSTRKKKNCK